MLRNLDDWEGEACAQGTPEKFEAEQKNVVFAEGEE